MTAVVLRCGTRPVPIVLSQLPLLAAESVPTTDNLDELVAKLDAVSRPRAVVLGDCVALAEVLAKLMRTERLHYEIGFVPDGPCPASLIYGTGVGAAAARTAVSGIPTEVPLIRDDTGRVLVGPAVITGPDDGPVVGEAYVDDHRLFSGEVKALRVEPTAELPGVRGAVERGRLRRPKWAHGRAVQLGTPGAVAALNGVADGRVRKRVSLYRHADPWILVR